jgi:hypothetical protein
MIGPARWKQTAFAIACLLVLAAPSGAQRPYLLTYSNENGLASPEPAQVFISRKGELWVGYSCCEHISRFDGVNWTHYPLGQLGLPSQLSFLAENEQGDWWTLPPWLVCFTPEGVWEKYSIPNVSATSWDPRTNEPIGMDSALYEFRFDPSARAFVPSQAPVYSLKSGEIFLNMNYTEDGFPYLSFTRPSDFGHYIRFGPGFQDSLEYPHPFFLPRVLANGRPGGFFFQNGRLGWYEAGESKLVSLLMPNGREAQAVSRVDIRKRQVGAAKEERPFGLIVKDPDTENLLLGMVDEDRKLRILLDHVPDNYMPAFTQDGEGAWWFSTSSGVMRANPFLLTFSETHPNMVYGLHAIGEDEEGRIWMGGYHGQGGFSVFDGKALRRAPLEGEPTRVLPGSYRSPSGSLYFLTEHLQNSLVAVQNGRIESRPGQERLIGYYFCPLSSGEVAIGLTGVGLCIAAERNGLLVSQQIIGKDRGMLLDNVLTIAEDRGGRLWLGRTAQGLALYDPARDAAVTWLRSIEDTATLGALSLLIDERGGLWIGAHNGLHYLPDAHLFDYQKDNPFQRAQRIELPGAPREIIHFLANTEKYIVAGSQTGVYFYDKNYRGARPRIFSLIYGKDIDGGSSEQNAVLVDSKGFLWVGAQRGATRIDLGKLRFDTSETRISLGSFFAGGEETLRPDGRIGKIPINKRNMKFSFLPSGNPFLKDDLYYDVSIVNDKEETLFQRLSTRKKTLEMYLPYGNYTLRIKAYKHNVLSGEAEWSFTVPRMLQENLWFWAFIASLALAIPFLWYLHRKQRQQLVLKHQIAAEKARREQDGLRMQALSNFFNPHFINNALHWVQSRYRKDPDTRLIIDNLASNVNILHSNTEQGKAYHSLKQELEVVENYLSIQQVRFGDSLQVALSTPDDKDALAAFNIPAMLLQIHVENAVEKGIRNWGDGSGRLSFSVRLSEDACRIEIEDNGKGRRPSPDVETENGQNGSTAVMGALIKLLNAYNDDPITVRFEDRIFHTPETGSHGTRVIIHLPKRYRYEFS